MIPAQTESINSNEIIWKLIHKYFSYCIMMAILLDQSHTKESKITCRRKICKLEPQLTWWDFDVCSESRIILTYVRLHVGSYSHQLMNFKLVKVLWFLDKLCVFLKYKTKIMPRIFHTFSKVVLFMLLYITLLLRALFDEKWLNYSLTMSNYERFLLFISWFRIKFK